MDNISEFAPPRPKEKTPPKIFTKLSADTTVAERFGKEYRGGGKAEFQALKKLHEAAPDNVPKPLRLIEGESQSINGYEMDFIAGETALAFLRRSGSVPPEVRRQIAEVLQKFQKHKVAHGDINLENIIIKPDGTIFLIDPVGYGEILSSELDKYLQYDVDSLERTFETMDILENLNQAA